MRVRHSYSQKSPSRLGVNSGSHSLNPPLYHGTIPIHWGIHWEILWEIRWKIHWEGKSVGVSTIHSLSSSTATACRIVDVWPETLEHLLSRFLLHEFYRNSAVMILSHGGPLVKQGTVLIMLSVWNKITHQIRNCLVQSKKLNSEMS